MAIKKKPSSLEAIISEGASVTQDKITPRRINFCLSMPSDMHEEIARLVEERPGMTKTAWILETIHERILKIKSKENK